ncbi:MAG TPA: hypothetical protein VMJ64_08755 [Anaerolineales bacterium]|nr:hypothetical protein [Anaerolineales bacterium]
MSVAVAPAVGDEIASAAVETGAAWLVGDAACEHAVSPISSAPKHVR